MAAVCPMQVAGTTVAAIDVEGGVGLSFTTTTGDVTVLRQRVRRMAQMHDPHGGDTMMGGHDTAAPDAEAEDQHRARAAASDEGGGGEGMMMGGGMKMAGNMKMAGGMMMPAATASVEDIEAGARLILWPKDPAQLGALRDHVHMKAQRMTAGECQMMANDSGGEPAPAPSNPGDMNHDAHHPGK